MKLSLNWISDFVAIDDLSPEEIVQALTRSTCEVENYEKVYDHLSGIRVVKIIEKKSHPGADRLSLCLVDTGTQKKQIVCGAPNAAAGIFVPLAESGALLPKKDGKPLEIKATTIRGQKSEGMLCSAEELQLADIFPHNNGLLILSRDGVAAASDKKMDADDLPVEMKSITPGQYLVELLPLPDTILEIDNKSITHRPDLWSHFGFAREIAAIFRRKLKNNPLEIKGIIQKTDLPIKKINIERNAARAYFGVCCNGVRVKKSPLWMQARLLNIGQRPKNNLVDASNYLMFEIGQPNHIFDFKSLVSDTITIGEVPAGKRKGKGAGEFVAIDGEKILIYQGTVLILDGKGDSASPLAIGGITGSQSSAVSEETDSVFLESATFYREKIRSTLLKTSLRTESAIRFEKGMDSNKARPALLRLIELLRYTCPDLQSGRICGEIVDITPRNIIKTSVDFISKRLGFSVKVNDAIKSLERLDFKVRSVAGGSGKRLSITVPTFRSQYDVSIPEDIVEEIGRLHGYDNIEPVEPKFGGKALLFNEERSFERRLKNFIIEAGRFNETNNYSFNSVQENNLFGLEGLKLKNPAFVDRDRLRVNLIPGLIRQAVLNQDRFGDVRLFEFGRIYHKNGDRKNDNLADEKKRISLIWIPPDMPEQESRGKEDSPIFKRFLQLRSICEQMFARFISIPVETFLPEKSENKGSIIDILHPGCRTAWRTEMKERIFLGACGIMSPVLEKRYGFKRSALIADIYFDKLFQLYKREKGVSNYRPPSVYPESHFEFSIVADEKTSSAYPIGLIKKMNLNEIKSILLLNIYRGDPLPADKKSLSYQVFCQKKDGTLPGERLQNILDEVVAMLAGNGFQLRT